LHFIRIDGNNGQAEGPPILISPAGATHGEVISMFVSSPIVNSFSVKAYVGDEKTLLAFNFQSAEKAKNLAGFTIFCQPPGQVPGYFLENFLQFENPGKQSQVPAPEKPSSTVNAPIQKYRWTHYPGTAHQGVSPVFGDYTYKVTPRYFDSSGAMQALDSSLSAVVTVLVGPFKKGALTLGFTRGYMQSSA
jgi:hypothetical protein